MNDDLVNNDVLGGPAVFGDAGISTSQGSGTISFVEFITHNHSLLALWFARIDESPPGLTRRHRFFIFFFVLVMVFFVTLQVELAGYEGGAWLMIWLMSVCIVLPIACRLKSDLPMLSERINQRKLFGPVLVEEMLLAIFLFGSVVGGFTSGGAEVTAATLYHFTGSYAAALASELATLIWQYFFCRACCICCLPPGEGDYAGAV